MGGAEESTDAHPGTYADNDAIKESTINPYNSEKSSFADKLALRIVRPDGRQLMTLRVSPENSIGGLTHAVMRQAKAAFEKAGTPGAGVPELALAYNGYALPDELTIGEMELPEGISFTTVSPAQWEAMPLFPGTEAPPDANALQIQDRTGRHLASLPFFRDKCAKAITSSLSAAAGFGKEVDLFLSLDGRLIKPQQTLEEAGVYPGATLTVFKFPEVFVFTSYDDGVVRLWNMETASYARVADTQQKDAICTDMSANGLWMMSGFVDGLATLWSLDTGKVVAQFLNPKGPVVAVTSSGDGSMVLTGSFDRSVYLWETASNSTMRKVTGHVGSISALAFAPNDELFASGSQDGVCKIWKVAGEGHAGEVNLSGHRGLVSMIRFSPDSRRVATASADATAIIWDSRTGRRITALQGHRSGITCLAFSPDGKRIVTGCADATAAVWDVSTGVCTAGLDGHTLGMPIKAVAFAQSGMVVGTGSDDGTVRLWSTDTGEQLNKLHGGYERKPPGQRPCVRALAFVDGGPAPSMDEPDEPIPDDFDPQLSHHLRNSYRQA